MKITSYDIHTWAKQASDDFITNNIPLNSSIIKIAREKGLNKEQIARLVERTNATTYVSKMGNASNEEKYIEFPVADTVKIASALDFKDLQPDLSSDYDLPPKSSVTEVKLAQLFPGIEEPLEGVKLTEHQKYLLKRAALDVQNRIETTKREIAVSFDLESNDFIENIKNAALTPYTCFTEISERLENLNPSTSAVITPLLKQAALKIPENLQQSATSGEYDFSSLEKQAEYLQQTITAYKNLDELKPELIKSAIEKEAIGLLGTAASKLFSTSGKILQTISKSRGAMAASLVGAGLVTGAVVGAAKKTGEEKALQATSPLKTVPPEYTRWRS